MTDEKKRILKKCIKIGAWTLGCFSGLIALLLTALVLIFTPQRLTPLVEKAANDYLNADVKIGRIELTAWSTFPDLTIDVQNLSIESKAFDKLTAIQRAELPQNSDSLVSLKSLHAGVNVLKLLYGTFSLKDLSVDGLRLNLVTYSPQLSNYDITPPSKEKKDDSPTTLPTLYWDKLNITNCKGITYYDYPSQLDVKLNMPNLSLDNEEDDNYRLITKGNLDYAMGGFQFVKDLPYEFNGKIEWNSDKLMNVALNDMKAKIIDIPIGVNVGVTIEDKSMLQKLDLDLGPVKLASVVPHLPKEYQSLFARIQSNISAKVKLHLKEPYDMNSGGYPSLDASLVVPDSYIKRLNYRLDKLGMDAKISIDGKKPNNSTLILNKFILDGHSMHLDLKARIDNIFADAHVKGAMKGNANLGTIMEVLNLPLDFSVKGELEANANVDMHLSDLSRNNFQRMKINGSAKLANLCFRNPVDSIDIDVNKAEFAFGSNKNISVDGKSFNDLLHFTLNMHGIVSEIGGTKMMLSNGEVKAGCTGNIAKADTSNIVPFGGVIKIDNFVMTQPDSSSLKIKNLNSSASLQRYNDSAKMPKLHLGMTLSKISYKDALAKMNLHDGRFEINANLRQHHNNGEKAKRIEELRKLHPGMSNDSILALASAGRSIEGNVMDMSVQNSGFRDLLTKWQIDANIIAKRGRLFTPYFPLKNRLQNLEMQFSTDSVIVKNVDYKVGHSTLNIKGSVHNIRTNLLGRNRRPLDVRFIVKADTIDVNQIVKAAVAGANFGALKTAPTTKRQSDADLDRLSEKMTSSADTTLGAILIPGNLNATISLRSKNILYGDMYMKKFNGDLLIHDRVMNLHELNAKTDMGSARLNALYVAPDVNNLKFSFDMGLTDIQVGKFIKMIPQIDSIMPLLNSVDGLINADLAATANLDSTMNILMPSLKAAVKLEGQDLIFMDAQTFKKVARMLLFKNKDRNVIDKMTVELLVDNSQMELFPFMFDVDRYRLGVLGYTNMDLNFRYHISVLKSPVPFKFGINIYGNPDKMHFRFGGAKYKKGVEMESVKIVDTTRVNLRKQISSAFKRGAKAALKSNLKFGKKMNYSEDLKLSDTITHEDSLQMIKAGLIEAPTPVSQPIVTPSQEIENTNKSSKKENKKGNKSKAANKKEESAWISSDDEDNNKRNILS